jgi:NitT/TauT family transport system substrate-binding protein
MYSETMANDNPGLTGSPLLGRGSALWKVKAACSTAGGRWRALYRRLLWAVLCLLLGFLFNFEAKAGDRLRLAVQKTGTFAWELAVIREHNLDRKAGLDLEVSEIASPEAAKIALLGGSADIILSDWVWVARIRNLGRRVVFWPYSTTLGAVMVPASSPIQDLAGLREKKIAVAGGPLDKGWLLLQALGKRSNIDLAREASIVYGAPALLFQKAAAGETDATLNQWSFCIKLERRGFRRLIGMDEVEKRLGAKGPVAMIGYVFDEGFGHAHAAALSRFLKIAAEAKAILANSGEDWQKIAKRIGIADETELALYRASYIDGIPRRPVADEAADARALYHILAEIGGPGLAGNAKELDEGIFYQDTQLAPLER